jgi:hypothetical protein
LHGNFHINNNDLRVICNPQDLHWDTKLKRRSPAFRGTFDRDMLYLGRKMLYLGRKSRIMSIEQGGGRIYTSASKREESRPTGMRILQM